MIQANAQITTPGSYLDRAIIQTAAGTARQLVNEGHAPATAIRLATFGAWAGYREAVKAFLGAGKPTPRSVLVSNNSGKGKEAMTKQLFVYLDRAYTSEKALIKYQGVPADEAAIFEYTGSQPSRLWRVQGGPSGDLITASLDEALAEFAAGGHCLFNVIVVRRMADNAAPDVAVLARQAEHVPDFTAQWLATVPSGSDLPHDTF